MEVLDLVLRTLLVWQLCGPWLWLLIIVLLYMVYGDNSTGVASRIIARLGDFWRVVVITVLFSPITTAWIFLYMLGKLIDRRYQDAGT